MVKPIILTFAGDSKALEKVFDKLDLKSKTTGSGFSKFAGIAKVAFAGLAGGAVAQLGLAVHAGDKLNESQDLLDNALKNTGQTSESFGGRLGPLLSQMAKWGITNDKVNDGLATLVRAGDSAATATTDMALAANVAKGRNIDLSSAEQLLVKVRTGHVALLGRYGIATKDANGKTISITAAIGKLSQMYKGSANVAAESLKGKTEALKAQFQNFQEHLGQKVIPILLKLADFMTGTVVPAFEKLVAWFQVEWPKIAEAVGPILATVSGYISGFVSTVSTLWRIFGGRIVSFTQKYFGSLKTAIAGALQVIQSVFRLFADLLTGKWWKLWGDILGIFSGVWKIIRGAIGTAWTEITSIVSLAWAGIKNVTSGAVGAVVGFVASIPGKILGLAGSFLAAGASLGGHILSGIVNAISGAASAVGNIASQVWNAFKGFLNNDLISPANNVLANIDVLGFHPFGKNTFPMLAKGAVVTGPTLAMIGEAGKEAVIPLSDMPRARAAAANLGLAGTGSVDNSRIFNTTINTRTQSDAREIAREVAWLNKTAGF